MSDSPQFVADGADRLLDAIVTEIRAAVEEQYAERLANATLWERWRLRREMRLEIARRRDAAASPLALY